MPNPVSMFDILKLSPAEHIQLAEGIWDSLAVKPETLKLTDAQRRELDARLAAYRANPCAGSPLMTVLNRIRSVL